MGTLNDLAGRRFGRLIALELLPYRDKYGQAIWQCRCDCGNILHFLSGNLVRGLSRSCGCLRRERGNRKHGHCIKRGQNSPTYNSWDAMKRRCQNPRCPKYKNYGGRGITVCERWQKFENFLEDMGERPPRTTIHRIDNDKNYEPGNCKWATSVEQAANRRPRRKRALSTIEYSSVAVATINKRVS